MKRKITSLLILLVMVGFNVSALPDEGVADGIYEIKCEATSKYMIPNGTTDVKMDATSVLFYIKANALDGTKYNITTLDDAYLVYNDGGKGQMMANTEANRNSADNGALLTLTSVSEGVYTIESTNGLETKFWNAQRSTNSDVGMGAYYGAKCDWTLIAAPATVSVTEPTEGMRYLAGVSDTLRALATAVYGQTLSSSSVEFFVDNVSVGVGTLKGDVYQLAWTSSTVLGTHAITAKVTDSGLNEATSSAVSVEVVTPKENPVKSVQIDFEDAVDADWTNENTWAGLHAIVADKGIDGSKALAFTHDPKVGRVAKVLSTVAADMIDVPTGDYVHVISSVTSTDTAAVSPFVSFKSTGGFDQGPSSTYPKLNKVAAGVYSTISAVKQHLGSYETQYSAWIMPKTLVQDAVPVSYFDNIVLYTDTNAVTDLVAPDTVTLFVKVVDAVSGSVDLSWTEGVDSLSGLVSSFILSTTTVGADAPELMSQSAYSVADVVGDWTVIGTVAAGTTTFNDPTGAVDYAIVNKDLAYNYSIGAIATLNQSTGLSKVAVSAFNCYGTTGAIELSAMPQGEQLTIFSISGAKVFAQAITSSDMTVDLSAGIYLVRVAGGVQKVVVQ